MSVRPSLARPLALSSCLFLRSNFSESEFVTKVFVREGGRSQDGLFARDIGELADTHGVSLGRNDDSRLTVTIEGRIASISPTSKSTRGVVVARRGAEGAMSATFYAFRFWHP